MHKLNSPSHRCVLVDHYLSPRVPREDVIAVITSGEQFGFHEMIASAPHHPRKLS
jgi:hypothetical protein